MPAIELDDEVVVNLRWLLEAIGAGRQSESIAYLTNANSGSWAARALQYLAAVDTGALAPLKSNDQLRIDLGRFAADAKTQEEVNTLRSQLTKAQALLERTHEQLETCGVPSEKPGDIVERIGKLAIATTREAPVR